MDAWKVIVTATCLNQSGGGAAVAVTAIDFTCEANARQAAEELNKVKHYNGYLNAIAVAA